jgi:flagellar M-ring protein FliF
LEKYAALMAGLIVVLAFGGRPAWRRVGPATKAESKATGKDLSAGAPTPQAPAFKPLEPMELDPERARAQEILDQVSGHLKREPTQSSRLLQSWIHSD